MEEISLMDSGVFSDSGPPLRARFGGEDESYYHRTLADFYKKKIGERQDILRSIYPGIDLRWGLPLDMANNMVENCINTYELPIGLGLNLLINRDYYIVPMVIEEPSVIAAISGASKMIAKSGGFKAYSTENISISQIQFLDVVDPKEAVRKILEHKNFLIEKANEFCESMKRRGGGVVDLYSRVVWYDPEKYGIVEKDEFLKSSEMIDREDVVMAFDGSRSMEWEVMGLKPYKSKLNFRPERPTACFLIVHIAIDTCESMGANLVTKVAEGLAPVILELIGSGRYLLRIVSNLCDEHRAKATFCISVDDMSYKGFDGMYVAQRIVEAYAMAVEDSYRTATHNKGIMNGVDAVAIAMGQDWRAIEAAVHAWAARSGRYSPLTSYVLLEDSKTGKRYLHGTCEFPVPIGVRGGSIQSHPAQTHTQKILGSPTSRQLGKILAAVGLAQNFAALRALVTEGVLRGHMNLHCKNIAISAGVPSHMLSQITECMINSGKINTQAATEFLHNYNSKKNYEQRHQNTFFFRLNDGKSGPKTIQLKFGAPNVRENSVHLSLIEESNDADTLQVPKNTNGSDFQELLFGSKDAGWFKKIFQLVNKIGVFRTSEPSSDVEDRLKLLSILMGSLVFRMALIYPVEARAFVRSVFSSQSVDQEIPPSSSSVVKVGFSLILELWQEFNRTLNIFIGSTQLAKTIRQEQANIFLASCNIFSKNFRSLKEFAVENCKSWQVTIFLLIDLQRLNLDEFSLVHEIIPLTLRIGEYLECEGIINRAMSRWSLDRRRNIPNYFLFWCDLYEVQPSEQLLVNFYHDVLKLQHGLKKKIIYSNRVFDMDLLLNSKFAIRHYYGDKTKSFRVSNL